MNRLKKLCTFLWFTALACIQASAGDDLSVSDIYYSDVYENWVIEIGIENPSVTYTSFQCDVAIPSSFTFNTSLYVFTSRAQKIVMGSTQTTHNLYSSVRANGTLRMVVASLNNSDFKETSGTVLVQAVMPTDASLDKSQSFKVNVTNIVLSHNDAGVVTPYYQQGLINDTDLRCYDSQCIHAAIYDSISSAELEAFNSGLISCDSLATVDLRHCTNTASLGTLTLMNPNTVIYTAAANKVTGNKNVVVNGTCSALTLVDKYPFRPTEAFTATKTTYSITLTDAGSATLTLPFSCSLPTGLKAYTLTSINGDGDAVIGEEIATITAHKPVLIKGASGTYKFEGASQTITVNNAPENELLEGSYLSLKVQPDNYVLQKQGTNVAFYQVTTGMSMNIKPFRAFLKASSGSGIRTFNIELSDLTLLNPINNGEEEVLERYNAAGMRIDSPVKGLNITRMKNGKVVKTIVVK